MEIILVTSTSVGKLQSCEIPRIMAPELLVMFMYAGIMNFYSPICSIANIGVFITM